MTNYRHIMIDLETLGTRPGDVILSIGAVWFDPNAELGVHEKSTFYCTIDQASSRKAGLRIQRSTIKWWQEQNKEAFTAAFKGEMSLESALTQFRMWLPPNETILIYGNGANFDNTLLAAAYRAIKQEVPWKYWNDRCYRTLAAMFWDKRTDEDTTRIGTYHNALDDAKTQAYRLVKIVKNNKLILK